MGSEMCIRDREAGVEKPEARLFELCVEKAGCAPDECVFVGDSLKGDVLGAMNAGLRAIWYSPIGSNASPQGAGVIRHMRELPELLNSNND